MNQDRPKISVITVVRNGERYIEDTIQSIINQTYDNFEYIVIDGKSTDNTLNIIRKYESQISYWISEADKGIYDAMNKGVRAATGDWLLFINADDFLFDNNVLANAAPALGKSKSLVVYGKVLRVYSKGSNQVIGSEWSELKHYCRNIRMNISHQGTFHSRQLFANRMFDTSFRIAGDYDLLLSYLNKNDAEYLPLTIAQMRTEGVSATSSNRLLLSEIRRVQINNGIYKRIPSYGWFKSAFRITFNNKIIKLIGIERKDKIKQLLNRRKA